MFGALAGQGLELLWLADAVDAFFLQVQGSGRIQLAEGGTTRVGFAAHNGHGFVSVGRILMDEGKLTKDQATAQAVAQWLKDHPAEAPAIMARNPRFIFFREIEGDGPVGAQGVVLTPERSMAVDGALLPLGAPFWIDTSWPAGTGQAGQPLQRLMISQDVGGAIKGAVRGDLFWGTGALALDVAGRLRQAGRYFILLPKTVKVPAPGELTSAALPSPDGPAIVAAMSAPETPTTAYPPRGPVRHLPGGSLPAVGGLCRRASCWSRPAARSRFRRRRPAAASPPTIPATAPMRGRWPAK